MDLRRVVRVAFAVLGFLILGLAAVSGAQEPDSTQYGLRLGEICSWPRKALEAWRYDNPHLRWKAFLLWENEGGWLAIDKQAHFASCYGGVLTGEIVGISTLPTVAVVSGTAILNELVEWKLGFWIPPKYRGISIKDIVVDACGIVVAILVVELFVEEN